MSIITGFLPTSIRLFFSKHYWINIFSFKKFLMSFFSVCGVAAAGIKTVKLIAELFNKSNRPNEVESYLSFNEWNVIGVIVVIATLSAFYQLKPITRVSARLKKRDLNLNIEVGDLFGTRQTLVIGTNTTFDTALTDGLIDTASLQGQFTKKYFNSNPIHLDANLEPSLKGLQYEELNKKEKRIGKLRRYEIGTVSKINLNSGHAYLVAMAHMNTHGVASTNIEDIRLALNELWVYISEKGGGLPSLRIPVLGTGFGKLTETREEVIKEILKSFVAACISDRFCDELTLVISVNDFLRYQIDLNELGDFLKYLTTFTEIRSANEVGKGTFMTI